MTPLDDHPSENDLLRFASDASDRDASERVRAHLDHCDRCFHTVLALREMRELETLGLMPAPDFRARPWESPGAARASTLAKGGIVGGIVGSIGAAVAGLLAGGRPSHHALAAEAGPEAPTISSGNVRNDGASPFSEGHRHPDEATVSSNAATPFHEANKHFGHPPIHLDPGDVHQQYADTCAVQCQRLILNDFGVDVSEDQLVREAEARHLYTPGSGTSIGDVGKLLEAHGLSVHRVQDANVFNLATELAQGHKVIVGVDSAELWHQNSVLESIADRLGIGEADHAVIVSGIDTTDPDHVKVVVTDPGTGDVAKRYPLTEFLDAWRTSDFSMVSTTEPAPSWHPEMVNFDYASGHLSHVGGVPYSMVEQMHAATLGESDPDVLGRLGAVFMQAAHPHSPLAHLLEGAASLSHDGHPGLDHAVSAMLSLAHGGASAESLVHSLGALLEGHLPGHAPPHASTTDTHAPSQPHSPSSFDPMAGAHGDAFGAGESDVWPGHGHEHAPGHGHAEPFDPGAAPSHDPADPGAPDHAPDSSGPHHGH